MLFPLENLLKEKPLIVMIDQDRNLMEAVEIMLGNDFSQLPVVDSDKKLIGLLTEHSLVKRFFHSDGARSLSMSTVRHFVESSMTLTGKDDIFTAIELLEQSPAIVIVKAGVPKGIFTNYDAIQFLHDVADGIIRIQDIEIKLRLYIQGIYSTDEKLNQALYQAFPSSRREGKQEKRFKNLTFGEQVQLITNKNNWQDFESYFQPKDLFTSFMNQVGKIRNQLMHFRGELTPIQRDALENTKSWLDNVPEFESRPKKTKRTPHEDQDEVGELDVIDFLEKIFRNWDDVTGEGILWGIIDDKDKLPSSAYKFASWWENDVVSNPKSYSWLHNGWVVYATDLDDDPEIWIKRKPSAYYQAFLSGMLDYLIVELNYSVRNEPDPFSSVFKFYFGVPIVFVRWEIVNENSLSIGLTLDSSEPDKCDEYFEVLQSRKAEIQKKIGDDELEFFKIPGTDPKISATKKFDIEDPNEWEPMFEWGASVSSKLIDLILDYRESLILLG